MIDLKILKYAYEVVAKINNMGVRPLFVNTL